MAPGTIRYKCVVPNCDNKYYWPITEKGFHNKPFFIIPQDVERRKKWLKILNIPFSTKCWKVCDEHFTENAFTCTRRRKLLKFALPMSPVDQKLKKEVAANEEENTTNIKDDPFSPKITSNQNKLIESESINGNANEVCDSKLRNIDWSNETILIEFAEISQSDNKLFDVQIEQEIITKQLPKDELIYQLPSGRKVVFY